MTLEGPLAKACIDCGETKPLSDFHRNAARRDGRSCYCKPCATARSQRSQARRREEMGEEAWLAHQRDVVQRSLEASDRKTSRAYNRARGRALAKLREMHRETYDRLLAIELDAERRLTT